MTARPNFQDSIHVGFMSGLKKFIEYFTSVLCFTTPGDGPRSTPQLVRTHEDGRQHPASPASPAPGLLDAAGIGQPWAWFPHPVIPGSPQAALWTVVFVSEALTGVGWGPFGVQCLGQWDT